MTQRILGIDPGLGTTGDGVVEITTAGPRVVEAGVVRSSSNRGTAEFASRLQVLYDGICEVLVQWKPSAMAIEQVYSHYDHPRTAILMAHARGCYLLASAQHNVPLFSYAATQIKKAVTGHGQASKEQMQYCIQRELHLAKPPEPHDVADALGIALCHYFASGHAVLGSRNATFVGVNRKAFELASTNDDDKIDREDIGS